LATGNCFCKRLLRIFQQLVAPVTKTSAVYETQSWGKTDQPDYFNQVITLQTNLAAQDVLNKILDIELLMGRKREEKWGSRIIDIDILFYGDAVINEPGLIVPHPELHNRRFTLEPLAEIAPDFAPSVK
jgi:2-amino-4-hydroxy-6-hydroxymethyldihydropteridine diphosphokinase